MNDWKQILADVDDDYLIGLSNKGIVKRAYKDKEEINVKIGGTEEEPVIKVGEETVTVHFPLGESKCTCPSRSMCRHVVQAIIVFKESCADGAAAEERSSGDEPLHEAVLQEESEAAPNDGLSSAIDKLRKEINEYPLAALKKAFGSQQLNKFISQVISDIKPEIQYSSIITVKLPEQEFVVKLLSPLEYSSCTCHKKELCVHKAEAIMWCQLEAGVLTREKLIEGTSDVQTYDMDKVREVAGGMKTFLEELLGTGLSRTSPDVLDYLERIAIISHNAGLARFEGYFRALSDSYDRYFKRKAAFKTEDLMVQITRLYRRVDLLLRSENSVEVSKYAGEFKAEYLPVGKLDLIGIAMEHFQSQTGYEGETIYFLEENTKKWYTYTNARPVFYDTGRKRRNMEKGQAPWGLDTSVESLSEVRLHLTNAKCDNRGRLSSSQETRGEIMGETVLRMSDIEGFYYRDFGRLFNEHIIKQQREWLFEQGDTPEGTELVFVQPHSCEKAEFSETGQMFSLPLYDENGKEVIVEVTYSKNEASTIRYLERISEKKLPCFLGKVWLRDGKIRMYPVALTDGKEIADE